MTTYRSVTHGITVGFEQRHAGWTTADGTVDTVWTVSIDVPSCRLALGPQPPTGKVRWDWDDRADGGTTLHLHGVGTTTRYEVDLARRRVDVAGTVGVTLGGVLEILSRWILPDLARRTLGALPLHATAVRTRSGAILLAGESGRGKSTLTIEWCATGTELLGDEPACVLPGTVGVSVLPGVATIRIDARSAERLLSTGGRWSSTTTVSDIAADKVTLADGRATATDAVPLRAIVVLDRRRTTGPSVVTERLSPEAAFSELFEHRYARPLVPDRVRADFVSLAAVVSRVPVFRASLLDDLAELPAAAQRLLDEVAGVR